MLIMTMKRWQMNLQFLGFYLGKIDGIKGSMTKSGTIEFKKTYGITPVNDIIDQKAIDVMRNIICEEQRKLGVEEDGVAGQVTIEAREKQNNIPNNVLSWDNIKHFKKEEFTCKCGCGMNNIDLRLVKILDDIRESFGKPCVVTSGCRCAKHNKNVGGVQGSRHVLGKAADIYIQGVHTNDLLTYTKNLVATNKLRYTYTNGSNMNGVVHVDIE